MKMTRKEFLQASASAAGAALLGGAGGISTASAFTVTATSSQGNRTLIKGATILSMDPKLGDIENGDVLFDGREILEVGHNISAANAEIIDAKDMILMPGMSDGHRHLWESMQVTRPDLTLVTWHMMWAAAMKPEAVYDYCYLGGKMAIDSGVTRVIDYCHVTHTPEKMEAAAHGAVDSGIGGINCPQLSGTVPFGPGDTVDFKTAWNRMTWPADDWHFELAEKLRDELFSDSEAPLQFGLAHSGAEGGQPREYIHAEWTRAQALEPKMMTGHVSGRYGGKAADYRVVPDMIKAGLLRDNYIVGHGNGLTDEELLMLKDVGAGLASTPRAEVRMNIPLPAGRCHKLGVPVAWGVDHLIYNTLDYFEHIRAADIAMWAQRGENKEIAKTMTARDYMHIATLGGAKALGIDSKVGSITPGKLADLVLLRTDRLGFPEIDDLAERVMTYASLADVDSVWVQGKLEKKDGELIDFDKGLYKKAIKSWDIARAEGETIKFIGADGNILSSADVRSPSFNPGRPVPASAPER
ncbi:MAG: amidohydrolase family protein [Gammaproteobacteria bacterium]|nr:amidohydrolase family protein [Gammaproteobacteria bacterium]